MGCRNGVEMRSEDWKDSGRGTTGRSVVQQLMTVGYVAEQFAEHAVAKPAASQQLPEFPDAVRGL